MTSVMLLDEIVHGHGELIRPVAVAIAHEQIAALRHRVLLLRSQHRVVERLHARIEPYARAHARTGPRPRSGRTRRSEARQCPPRPKAAPPASAKRRARRERQRAPQFSQNLAREQSQPYTRWSRVEPRERVLVTLGGDRSGGRRTGPRETPRWRKVGREAEPLEVVEDAALELRPRPLAVVVLDPQPHLAAGVPRKPPDVDRVEEMAEVQMAGGRGGEAGQITKLRIADCGLRITRIADYTDSVR